MKKLLPPKLFLLSILLMLLLDYSAPIAQISSLPYTLTGVLLLLTGLGFTGWGGIKFSRVETNIKTFNKPDKLVTDGLFRISRNPMYLGFALALVGIAIILGSLSPYLVCAGFILVTDRWYIRFEERAMMEAFGEAYRNYKYNTRRWL